MNLLVNPSSMVQLGYTPPPLGLLYIAAMNDDTYIVDAALGDDPYGFIYTNKPEIVLKI